MTTERLLIAGTFIVLLSALALIYNVTSVVPLKMAERGYCYQTTLVPAVAGQYGSQYSGYVPCDPAVAK